MNKEIDLSWGEPFCVREILDSMYTNNVKSDVKNMLYAPDEGNNALISKIKEFLKNQTGIDYKYVIITNGTTGAINVVLRAFSRQGKTKCYTRSTFFPYYPPIIEKNGFEHIKKLETTCNMLFNKKDSIILLDSPSNPEGKSSSYDSEFVIWDSVYHNNVYISEKAIVPKHKVNCGSFSKALGLTGSRIGWIATNNIEDYEDFLYENLYESCTVSVPSQDLILDILNNLDMDLFLKKSKDAIEKNRNELNRLKGLFNGRLVPNNGMFYVVEADDYMKDVIDRANVKVVDLGNNLIRFNLAQLNDLTKEAVDRIIKIVEDDHAKNQ